MKRCKLDQNITTSLHWPMFGQCSVELRSKGGKEAGCITDESCLEQGMSGANGGLELNHMGPGSGDWYVRHQL